MTHSFQKIFWYEFVVISIHNIHVYQYKYTILLRKYSSCFQTYFEFTFKLLLWGVLSLKSACLKISVSLHVQNFSSGVQTTNLVLGSENIYFSHTFKRRDLEKKTCCDLSIYCSLLPKEQF